VTRNSGLAQGAAKALHLRLSHRPTRHHPGVAIMVDELREYPHAPLPFTRWCHLASDASFDELHAFAARLGIPRHRFQGDHYDLPPHLRARAVALGAEEVGTRELTRRMAGPRGDRVRRRRLAR
jgi:hypothetical protein